MGRGILAIDAATRTGWAIATAEALASWPGLGAMSPGCGPIEGVSYGVIDMSLTKPRAARFCRFFRWYYDVLDSGEIGHVYYEATLQFQSSSQAKKIAEGLAAYIEGIAFDHLTPVTDIAPATIKLHFTGSGKAKKPEMIAEARRRGWKPSDDNAADALALLDLAAARYANRRRAA